jgi:hypothetical protein
MSTLKKAMAAGILVGAVIAADTLLGGVGRPGVGVGGVGRGVARRTTRRMIRRSTIYVASLPTACSTVVVEGVSLYSCGSTYYQASGTQYVVVTVE